jgi:hypothetical protein
MMTPSKRAVFLCALLLNLFSLFVVSAETDGDSAFHDVKDPTDSSGPYSQNQWHGISDLERQRTIDEQDQADDLNSYMGLSQNVLEELDNSQESGYDGLDKKGSSFVRIGKVYPMNRFIRIGRIYDEGGNSDASEEDKRASQFVRIGRAPSNFVRIGRAPSNFVRIGRAPSSFVRIGKSDDTHEELEKRASSFVRIGRAPSSFVRIGRAPSSFVRIGRAPSSFVRIGRAPSSFVRIGRAPSSFVRIGKSYEQPLDSTEGASDRLKRDTQFNRDSRAPSSFVRIGKAPSSFVRIGKAPSSFVRIGKAPSSFVRIGKAPSSFVRIGKAPSSFVRIGKAPSSFVRIGKAPSSFVRIGKDYLNYPEENLEADYNELSDLSEKRASSFVRIGKSDLGDNFLDQSQSSLEEAEDSSSEAKRASSFVRIGKSQLTEDSGEGKRASSFLRIGKSEPENEAISDLNKKDSSFVLFDKTQQSGNSESSSLSPSEPSPASSDNFKDGDHPSKDEPIKISTRGSAFVRIGKIPSSAFARIGKNTNVILDQDGANRRPRGNQFVRIGK